MGFTVRYRTATFLNPAVLLHVETVLVPVLVRVKIPYAMRLGGLGSARHRHARSRLKWRMMKVQPIMSRLHRGPRGAERSIDLGPRTSPPLPSPPLPSPPLPSPPCYLLRYLLVPTIPTSICLEGSTRRGRYRPRIYDDYIPVVECRSSFCGFGGRFYE